MTISVALSRLTKHSTDPLTVRTPDDWTMGRFVVVLIPECYMDIELCPLCTLLRLAWAYQRSHVYFYFSLFIFGIPFCSVSFSFFSFLTPGAAVHKRRLYFVSCTDSIEDVSSCSDKVAPQRPR